MSKKLRELQARKSQSVAAMRAITDKATAENREPSAEELTDYEGHKADVASINAAIEREQALIALEVAAPAAAAAAGVNVRDGASISVTENLDADPTGGFKSFAEFARAVRVAGIPGNHSRIDTRLAGRFNAAAPSTFGNEGAGTDGGFATPPVYAKNIFTLSQSEGSLLPYTDNVEIESNSMAFPKDETTPWGTDGVRAYWQAEATAGTANKPKIGLAELRMKKLLSLVPVSDELLADGAALDAYLPKKMADSIRWKTNDAILFGTGAGIPQGAFTSNAVVTVAKESGQATLTLQAVNLAKMIARLPEGSFSNAIWLMNNDVLPALFTLTLGNYPIYLPGGGPTVGGIQNNPYGTLLGRPIMVTQHAKSFTNAGDVMLADLSYYRTITKADGIEMATSLHLYFDADATAFRATFRIDGQSKIAAAITPANGSNTLTPFVQLGAR